PHRRQEPALVDVVLPENLSPRGQLHHEVSVRVRGRVPVGEDAHVLEELLQRRGRAVRLRVLARPESERREDEQDQEELALEQELGDRKRHLQKLALLLTQNFSMTSNGWGRGLQRVPRGTC